MGWKEEVGTEESLLEGNTSDRLGGCALFHLGGGNGGGEVVVEASSQIRVAHAEEFLAGLREYPQVADVWTE
jgi:hypothetical protein